MPQRNLEELRHDGKNHGVVGPAVLDEKREQLERTRDEDGRIVYPSELDIFETTRIHLEDDGGEHGVEAFGFVEKVRFNAYSVLYDLNLAPSGQTVMQVHENALDVNLYGDSSNGRFKCPYAIGERVRVHLQSFHPVGRVHTVIFGQSTIWYDVIVGDDGYAVHGLHEDLIRPPDD